MKTRSIASILIGRNGEPFTDKEQTGMAEGLWDAKDVASYLKVSRSWVYQHTEDGTLPSVRIGGLRRFFPERIRAYALGDSVFARGGHRG
jgi:excisionase family DNA binding protein